MSIAVTKLRSGEILTSDLSNQGTMIVARGAAAGDDPLTVSCGIIHAFHQTARIPDFVVKLTPWDFCCRDLYRGQWDAWRYCALYFVHCCA